jgi:hypothetical protein
VIRIYHLDKRLADVEILDGRLRIVGYSETDWVEALEDLRRFISPEMDHSCPTSNCTTLYRTSFAVTCGPNTWISC